MALVLSGSIDISGSMTATTIVVSAPGVAGMVSSSAQIRELVPLMQTTASLNSSTGSIKAEIAGIEAYTASLKSFYDGTVGQICAQVPYGNTTISYNLTSLPIGLYLVTAYMVRGGASANETYAVTWLYYHFSGGTDLVATVASNPGPMNNNGAVGISGTTVSVTWGGNRGPAAVVAVRLRDAF